MDSTAYKGESFQTLSCWTQDKAAERPAELTSAEGNDKISASIFLSITISDFWRQVELFKNI